ncbi:IS110 family transposase (plasmid) [Tundrisphaera lichenicola]|uniref:IS110 family transposase n=1 Tax=Tundrisphaera lichenicola TaxID=2029860 RepID=UPI003EB9E03D
MDRYVGLDLHKQFIEVCALDDKGKVAYRGRTGCLRQELEAFARAQLTKTDHIALEATTNTWAVVNVLRPFVARVVVGNPLKTRAIAEAKVKTDKVNAEVLAQLLRCDYLPTVWQPDQDTQQLRGLLTHRAALMTQRSRAKNRVQCLLARLLLQPPCKVLWTKTGMAWLKALDLPAHARLARDSELRQIALIDGELAEIDKELAESARKEKRVQLLMTIPGVNYVVALGLLSALGDIGRFRDGDHAASYLGLVPSTRQSGRKCYHGPITKSGSPQARGLLTQAAQHASRHPGPIGAFFRRLSKRKSRAVAITAVARKLVTIAYLMLKNNEPYRYARPELMREKFAKLQGAGTQAAEGTQASPRAKAGSGLAEVYRSAQLPPVTAPESLPAGERRMLAERELGDFVRGLYQGKSADSGAEPAEDRGRKKGEQEPANSGETGRPAGRRK